MRSYEELIFKWIKEKNKVNRKETIHEFQHISPKTVYQNINRLIQAGRINEDKFGYLTVSKKELMESRDTWPMHPVLREFVNVDEITNAFANQDFEFITKCKELSHKYGTELTILLTDLTIMLATLKSVDIWKAYEEKTPVDRDELNRQFEQLETVLSTYKVSVKA